MLKKWLRYESTKYYSLIILRLYRGELYKIINLLGILVAYFFKFKKVIFLPASVDIELNNNCNLRCKHCQVSYWKKDIKYLDMKSYQHILNQFPYLLSAKLQGMGEPFLNGQLPSMLKEGEDRGISMQVITNGTIYNENIAKQLILLKNTHISYSIDGATSETHENIREGSNFDKILGNIRDLANRRGLAEYPRLSMYSVITKNNINETTKIVELSRLLNLDSINLQTTLVNWGKNNVDQYNKTISIDTKSKQFDHIWREAKNVAKEKKIKLEISSKMFSKNKKCPWPWISAYIAVNGDVVPCCNLADSDTLKMGNIFDKSFSDIWNSRDYVLLRERIRVNDIPEFCKSCYIE